MKEILKTVYYCDHCKKHFISKYFAEKHEKQCNKNPENQRACIYCPFLEKQDAIQIIDSDERHVKALVCTAFNYAVYPPRVEINKNPMELVDIDNYPMPKFCDTETNPFK